MNAFKIIKILNSKSKFINNKINVKKYYFYLLIFKLLLNYKKLK